MLVTSSGGLRRRRPEFGCRKCSRSDVWRAFKNRSVASKTRDEAGRGAEGGGGGKVGEGVAVVISKMLKVVAAVAAAVVPPSLKQAVTSCPSSCSAQSPGSPHTDKEKDKINQNS